MIACIALAAAMEFSSPRSTPPTAFLTFESGVLVGVDWIEREGTRVHTRSILMQSRVIDATITLRDDETMARASTTVAAAGSEAGKPVERSLGEGTIYWSDMTPSSIEQAVRRALVLDQPTARIAATSLFRDSRDEVEVTRIDSTDWVVSCHNKRYEVLTDDRGRMLAASLPEFGVTIERREGFRPEQYPLWPNEVAIRAPRGTCSPGRSRPRRDVGRFLRPC